MEKKINVALVGLSFGGAFVPIYTHHPDVGEVSLFDTNPDVLKEVGGRFGVKKLFSSFEALLADDTIDAVHLISPIPCHEEQSIRVLEAGKHCACTVPMALSLDGIRKIIAAKRKSGKNYMMMETSVYTRHFFYLRDMIEKGSLGEIQFMKGTHYQDMEFWPSYWMGLPPMWYGTHAIAPLLTAAGCRAVRTVCFGSGRMREELVKQYQNPYPAEMALFELENGIKAEATRSLFETCRDYTEAFNIYGTKSTFEWQQIEGEEQPVIYTFDEPGKFHVEDTARGRNVSYRRIDLPDRQELLPEEIRKFTVRSKFYDERNPQLMIEEGGGHGGSHPHLVHEFVRSILENRKPWLDEIFGANVTAAGICAHESAMQGGKEVVIPDFTQEV